ncbi:MAG: profilin domain protein [Spirochaetales bacterium]|nr:profilin domain protein [Spirochaetales bacterium]
MQKKVSLQALLKIIQQIEKDPEKARGDYLVGDTRVRILRAGATTNERVRALYRRRRASGLCINCGAKVKKKNPYTGQLYRLCETHRSEIDHNRQRR